MRKRYPAAFKAKTVTELLKEEKTLAQLSSESGVSTKQLTRWKNYALAEMPRLYEHKSDKIKGYWGPWIGFGLSALYFATNYTNFSFCLCKFVAKNFIPIQRSQCRVIQLFNSE